jgi:S-adenosyl methyltransferase
MREPERILADSGLAELIDLDRPSCVILSGVLHFLNAQAAREVAAAFARAISPASYLITSRRPHRESGPQPASSQVTEHRRPDCNPAPNRIRFIISSSTTTLSVGSPATVRNYLSSAISKVGGHNRIDAIRLARDNGWL